MTMYDLEARLHLSFLAKQNFPDIRIDVSTINKLCEYTVYNKNKTQTVSYFQIWNDTMKGFVDIRFTKSVQSRRTLNIIGVKDLRTLGK